MALVSPRPNPTRFVASKARLSTFDRLVFAPRAARGQHLAFFDALRGIAVLGVVLVHAMIFLSSLGINVTRSLSPLISSGQYGVQLFFIASAVTLAYSHDRRKETGPSTRDFFLRRYFRIAPMYTLAALLYTGITCARHGLPNLDAVALNLCFLHPYSKEAFNTVPPGGWSVGVETQFYVLLPLLLPVVRNLRASLVFLAVSLAICLASYAELRHLGVTVQDNTFFYFWLPNQLPAFALGLVVYQTIKTSLFSPVVAEVRRPSPLLIAALASLLGVFVVRVPSPLYHLVVLGPLALLVVGLARAPWGALVNRPLCALGKTSFSIYLLHFLVIQVVGLFWKRFHLPIPGTLNLALFYGIVVASTSVVATFTHKTIEVKGGELGNRLIESLKERRKIATMVA